MTYIEREALGIGKANRDVFENPAYADGWNAAIDIIEAAPAADVVPVKHSTWEVAVGYDPKRMAQCQNCFKMAYEPSAFCPACGAKMDLED